MKVICQMLIALGLLLTNAVRAQISSTPPTEFHNEAKLDYYDSFTFTDIDNAKEIRRELLDTNTLLFIAQANGLTKADLAAVEIAPDMDFIMLYQIGKSDKAFNLLKDQLRAYASERKDGHSRVFLLNAIKNRLNLATITDPDLRMLATNQLLLAVSWLTKENTGTYTNKAGQIVSISTSGTIVNGQEQSITTTNMQKEDEVMRWVSYTGADGDIAWRYTLNFKPNGQLDFVRSERFDAKELDPRYAQMIKNVESEVEAEMKNGQYGQLGSVHTFWMLTAEKLKAKGIEWHSPDELNRNTIYD